MRTLVPFGAAFLLLGGCGDDSSSNPPAPDSGADGPAMEASTSADAGNRGSDATPSDSGDAGALTFHANVYPLISANCLFCHHPAVDGGAAGPGVLFGKLDMSSVDAGYANLVNVPAQGIGAPGQSDAGIVACATLADAGTAGSVRVVPNDPGASLLYLKVNGFTTPPPCGSAMPLGFELPDGGQAALAAEIQTWINEGALP